MTCMFRLIVRGRYHLLRKRISNGKLRWDQQRLRRPAGVSQGRIPPGKRRRHQRHVHSSAGVFRGRIPQGKRRRHQRRVHRLRQRRLRLGSGPVPIRCVKWHIDLVHCKSAAESDQAAQWASPLWFKTALKCIPHLQGFYSAPIWGFQVRCRGLPDSRYQIHPKR